MTAVSGGVQRKAKEALRACGVTELPVNVDGVALQKSIKVEQVPAIRPGIFGAFYIDGAEGGILISSECFSENHRRFTLAHELGHFILDGHVQELLPTGSGLAVSMGGNYRDQISRIEREADAFAAELLMPPDQVREHVRGESTLDSVRNLACRCRTSLSSAAIRLVELNDDPLAVVLSHKGEIEWYACSPVLREHRWARNRLRGEWIPRRSATRRLLETPAAVSRDAEDSQSLLLCEWFDGAPETCYVDEECLRMAGYERVLTLLRPLDMPLFEEIEEERQRADDREKDWRNAVRPWEWD